MQRTQTRNRETLKSSPSSRGRFRLFVCGVYAQDTGAAQAHSHTNRKQDQPATAALQLAVPAVLTCLPRLSPKRHSPRLPRTRQNQLSSLPWPPQPCKTCTIHRKNKEGQLPVAMLRSTAVVSCGARAALVCDDKRLLLATTPSKPKHAETAFNSLQPNTTAWIFRGCTHKTATSLRPELFASA